MKEMSKYLFVVFTSILIFSCENTTDVKTTETDVEFRLESLANRGWKSKKINLNILKRKKNQLT